MGVESVLLRSGGSRMFRMLLSRPGYIEDYIAKHGCWEPNLVRILGLYVKRNHLFLDVGANIGYISLYTAATHPAVTCMGFEPHPGIFAEFDQNIKLNALPNLTAHNVAVGDQNASIDFFIQGDSAYNRGLSSSHAHLVGSDSRKVTVPSVRLDDMLTPEQKKMVCVLKIDTQGYEYQVIMGAQEMIRLSQPVIVFEYHHDTGYGLAQIIRLLSGYRLFRMHPVSSKVTSFRLESAVNARDRFDILCIPPSLDLRFPITSERQTTAPQKRPQTKSRQPKVRPPRRKRIRHGKRHLR